MKIKSPVWFLAGILIIPLVFTTETIDPAFTLRAILLSALTIVTLIATLRRPLRLSPILHIWSAYAAFNIASIFVAQNSGEAIYKASIVLMYGAWLFASLQIMTKELRPLVIRTIAIIGFVISIISIFQYFGLGFDNIPSWESPGATMASKNLMSSFLFLTLPATLYVALIEKKIWDIFGLLTLALSIFVLLFTQTRAVWLGSSVAGFVALILFVISTQRSVLWRSYGSQIRNSVIIVAACAIAIFVFDIVPRAGIREKSAAEKAVTLAHFTSDTSAQMRLTVWKESLELHRDHPFLGVGAGNWKIAIPKYGLANFPHYIQDGSVQWTETHNDFLNTLCETGIPGGLAFIAFFVLAVYIAVRYVVSKGNNSNEAMLGILIGAMVCGYGTISFFDFPNARIEHSMILMLWLSMLPTSSGMSKKLSKGFPSYLPYAAIVLAFPALLFSIQRFTAETDEKHILESRIDQNWENVISGCNKIYNPKLLSVDALSTPILYYKAEAEFMEGDYGKALKDNIEALQAHPNHFYTLNNAGSSEVKLSNFQAGEVFYKRALAISPNFEESLLNLATVYFNQNKYDSAFECVRRCDTSQEDSRGQKIARALWGHIK